MVQSVILIKKMENEIFKIVTPGEILKFYINKDTTKNSLSFQLTSVSRKLPKSKDRKIYNLSLTKNRRKKKKANGRTNRNSSYSFTTKL